MKYVIRLVGCDDATVLTADLNDEQATLVRVLCALSVKASTYG